MIWSDEALNHLDGRLCERHLPGEHVTPGCIRRSVLLGENMMVQERFQEDHKSLHTSSQRYICSSSSATPTLVSSGRVTVLVHIRIEKVFSHISYQSSSDSCEQLQTCSPPQCTRKMSALLALVKLFIAQVRWQPRLMHQSTLIPDLFGF